MGKKTLLCRLVEAFFQLRAKNFSLTRIHCKCRDIFSSL